MQGIFPLQQIHGGEVVPLARLTVIVTALKKMTKLHICSNINLSMKKFKNFRNEMIFLARETLEHIKEVHPEIQIVMIRETLASPDEVRKSRQKADSELYYVKKKENRFICVIVKICNDGNFISTAMTASKPKMGIVVYKKGK